MSKLVCTYGPNKGDEFAIMPGDTFVGRNHKDCQVDLFDKRVSHQHIRVHREGKNCVVEDIGSRNGTFLNGKNIGTRNKAPLAEGDVLTLGGTKLTYSEKGIGSVLEQTMTDAAADLQEKKFTKLISNASANVKKQSAEKAADDIPSFLTKVKSLLSMKR